MNRRCGGPQLREEETVRSRQRVLSAGLILAALAPVGISIGLAAPAAADCNNAGYATVCAQGTVTGGSTAPVQGPVYPGYCADPWYCNDGWGIDIDIDRPNRPGGGGGGIGPRR
jgi:hypothetical protein